MEPDHLKIGVVLAEAWEIIQVWQLGFLLTYLATKLRELKKKKLREFKMNHAFGNSYETN